MGTVAKRVGNNQESKVDLEWIVKHSQKSTEKLGAVGDVLEYECGHGTLLPIVKKLRILNYLIMHGIDGGNNLDFGVAMAVSYIVSDCAGYLEHVIRLAAEGNLSQALY